MKYPNIGDHFKCVNNSFLLNFICFIFDFPLVCFTYQYFLYFSYLISFRHPVVFILHKEWVIWSTTRNTLSTISHRSCLCVWSAMPEPEAVQITPTPSIHISQHPPSPPLPQNRPVETSSCVSIWPWSRI